MWKYVSLQGVINIFPYVLLNYGLSWCPYLIYDGGTHKNVTDYPCTVLITEAALCPGPRWYNVVVNYVVRWWQSWIPIAFHSTVNRVVNNISNDILLHNHCQYFILVFNFFASIHTFLLDTYIRLLNSAESVFQKRINK